MTKRIPKNQIIIQKCLPKFFVTKKKRLVILFQPFKKDLPCPQLFQTCDSFCKNSFQKYLKPCPNFSRLVIGPCKKLLFSFVQQKPCPKFSRLVNQKLSFSHSKVLCAAEALPKFFQTCDSFSAKTPFQPFKSTLCRGSPVQIFLDL